MRWCVLAIIAVSCAAQISCDNGVAPNDNDRIVLYESVDGVRIGDDAAMVIRKLGQPSSVVQGDFPGVRFEYHDGVHATMNIVIYDPTAIPSGVVSLAVFAPYSGKTEEGIGIGSTHQEVLEGLGEPSVHHQSTDSTSWDDYNNVKYLFIFGYVDNRVKSIQFGLRTWPEARGGE